MIARQPSPRLLELLNKADDPDFVRRFNAQPGAVFTEYGIHQDEAEVLLNASYHRKEPLPTQKEAIHAAFKLLGLDPDQHAALVKKLVDNYDIAW